MPRQRGEEDRRESQGALARELPVACLREDTAGAIESPKTSGRGAKEEEVCDYNGGLEDWTVVGRLKPGDVRRSSEVKSVTTRVVWKSGQPRKGWRHGTRNATSGTTEGSVLHSTGERERPTN